MGHMQRGTRWLLFAAVALALTFGSSAVRWSRLEVQDWDCPPEPGSCARRVVVRGFPAPYISDYHGISVVGDASLVGALLGEDLFHLPAFATNTGLYFLLVASASRLISRRRRMSA